MSDRDALAGIWIYIADSSCRGYSPLYDRICRAVAESDAVLEMVDAVPSAAAPSDDQGVAASVLGLTVFRDGAADAKMLGYAHPHGSWIDWRT